MTARRNIMRRFKIDEISAVDVPCQEHARAVIFKRGSPAAEPVLKAAQADSGNDWSKRRESALQTLQKLAEDRAVAKGESLSSAYVAVMATPAGAALYERTA